MRIVALTMCFLAAGAAAEAQERPLAGADLPRGVEARLNAIIKAPETRKVQGDVSILRTRGGQRGRVFGAGHRIRQDPWAIPSSSTGSLSAR